MLVHIYLTFHGFIYLINNQGEQDYSALLKILVAGLAGTTTHMIAAAVTSITHLFFHFKVIHFPQRSEITAS